MKVTEVKNRFNNQLQHWANHWAVSLGELLFAAFLFFAFLSGIQAHLLPAVYPLTRYITDALLLVVCLPLLWFSYQRGQDQRLWWWCIITYLGTFFIEAIGVATGAVFGTYTYGPTMWAQWLNVPLVIALNWTLLIMATSQLASLISRSPLIIALLTGGFIIIYDFFIEPVAIALDYWTWASVTIPTQNYLAWGVIAVLFSYPLHRLQIRYQNPLLLVYALAQLLFFWGLQLFF